MKQIWTEETKELPTCPNLVQVLKHLLELPYWRRSWIIQEIAVSKKSVLMCGVELTSLDTFGIFLDRALYKLASSGYIKRRDCYPVTNMRATRDKHRSQDRFAVPLVNALISSSRYLASDRRDSIYGILGLVTSGKYQDIEADYTISLCTVDCISVCAFEEDYTARSPENLSGFSTKKLFLPTDHDPSTRTPSRNLIQLCCGTLNDVENPLATINWPECECDGYCCGSVSALIEAVDDWLSRR
jgi:hypothetical protein